jgi:hypothetical protein
MAEATYYGITTAYLMAPMSRPPVRRGRPISRETCALAGALSGAALTGPTLRHGAGAGHRGSVDLPIDFASLWVRYNQ